MRLHQMPVNKQRTVRVLIVEDEPMIALSLEDVLIGPVVSHREHEAAVLP